MAKVLLVDDVRLFLELEKTVLSRSNLQIFTATSGLEAIGIHKREMVDLILCDLYMPVMNGDEVCRIIRSDVALRNVSIVIITTSDSEEDIERCVSAGANDYIAKPINPTELLNKVKRFINVAIRTNGRLTVRLTVEGSADSDSELFVGNTVNISSSGFLIETVHHFTAGDSASFILAMPDKDDRVNVKGQVVRRTSGVDPNMNYYGINFIDINDDCKKSIEEFVKLNTYATF